MIESNPGDKQYCLGEENKNYSIYLEEIQQSSFHDKDTRVVLGEVQIQNILHALDCHI